MILLQQNLIDIYLLNFYVDGKLCRQMKIWESWVKEVINFKMFREYGPELYEGHSTNNVTKALFIKTTCAIFTNDTEINRMF